MANRNIQSKILKQKRRGRFARFTGATAKFAVRIDRGRFDANGKAVEIPVGQISLSKAVMSTGRGPDPERMQAYYSRVTPKSFQTEIPETKGVLPGREELIKRYEEHIRKMNVHRIVLISNDLMKLELVFSDRQWMFVEMDGRKKYIRRSRVYGSRAFAMGRLKNEMVTWVETISLSKVT